MSIPVVYDTMLYFQAASRPERTRASVQAIRDGRLDLCISAEILAEVRSVLVRPEYLAKFPALRPDRVDAFLEDLLSVARFFSQVPTPFHWVEHPKDDHVINLAIHAKVKYLVTWENRILNLVKGTTTAGSSLRSLAPDLTIISPKTLADLLTGGIS